MRQRVFAGCMAILTLAAVAVAVGYQVIGGHAPCVLCIVQRYLFVLAAAAFVAVVFVPAALARPLYWLVWLFMLSGLAVSLEHLRILTDPSAACGRDALESVVNGLSLASIMPTLFMASGFCTAKLPPLLGLSMPTWGFVGFSGLSAAALVGAFCPWLSGKESS